MRRPSIDAALNAAILKATAEIEALPEVSKVVGPGVDLRRGRAGAGRRQSAGAVRRLTMPSVTDAYIFALSGGNTEIGSYVHDGLDAYRLVVFFPYLDNSRLEQLTQREIRVDPRAKHFGRRAARLRGDIRRARCSGPTWTTRFRAARSPASLVMALACFATFFLSLRDWRLAASAMFVNVLPVAVVGALLGAIGRPIDMATVFIMGISLGVAVDDTSFFVHGYLERGA